LTSLVWKLIERAKLNPPNPLIKNKWQSLSLKSYLHILREITANDFDCILDAGCGLGVMAELLSRVSWEKGMYIGCDILKDLGSRRFKKKFTEYVICDLNCLPFRSKSVDVSLCRHVLEHLHNPYYVLKELCRVTRKCMIISFPYSRFKLDRIFWIDHIHSISLEKTYSIFNAENFAVEDERHLIIFPYGLLDVFKLPINSFTLKLCDIFARLLAIKDVFIRGRVALA